MKTTIIKSNGKKGFKTMLSLLLGVIIISVASCKKETPVKPGYQVQGNLVDSLGKPMPNHTIWLVGAKSLSINFSPEYDTPIITFTTDKNGNCCIIKRLCWLCTISQLH